MDKTRVVLGMVLLLLLGVTSSTAINYVQANHEDLDYVSYNNKTLCLNTKMEKFTGYSMQPTIFTNNLLLISNYNNDTLKEGMIIGFDYEGQIIVHRIKGIYKNYLVTQGDNSDVMEEILYQDVKYIVKGVLYG